MATQSTLVETFEAAVAGATNDECVEITYRLHQHLADRAKHVSDLARDVDDRDGVNEAYAFVMCASDLVPCRFESQDKRGNKAWVAILDAERALERSIKRRGKSDPIPWSEKTREEQRQEIDADIERREREQEAGDRLVARTDLSPARVLEALRSARAPGELLQAKDVAILLVPKAKDRKLPGRQRLINRVGMVLRNLAEAGELERLRPEDNADGRASSRFKLRGAS